MSSFQAVPEDEADSHEDIFVDVPEVELSAVSASSTVPPAAVESRKSSPSFADRVLAGRPESEALVVNYFFGKYNEVEQPGCCARTCCGKRTEYTVVKFQSYKYGLPGSNGEFWANYVSYQFNNQEVLAIFAADALNPLSRWQRFFIFACGSTATLFVNALFQGKGDDAGSQVAGIIVSIIIQQPVQIFLTQTALMQLCEKNNCCVKCAHFVGNFLFICVSFGFLAIFLTIAILEITGQASAWADQFIRSYFLSIGVAWAKTLVLDAPNWYVESWKKMPIVGYSSLLRTLLNLALPPLFAETYAESKARFQKNYAEDAKDILQYRDKMCAHKTDSVIATDVTTTSEVAI